MPTEEMEHQNDPLFQMIVEELNRVDLVTPGRTNPEEIMAMADIFTEELMTAEFETVRLAIRLHARDHDFLPTLRELRESVDCIKEQRRRERAVLPMPPELTDEQVALNLAYIHKLRKKLGWKMAMPDSRIINSADKLRAQAQELMRKESKDDGEAV